MGIDQLLVTLVKGINEKALSVYYMAQTLLSPENINTKTKTNPAFKEYTESASKNNVCLYALVLLLFVRWARGKHIFLVNI